MLGLGPKGDFSLSSDSPVTVPQGHAGTVAISVASANHFSGDVSVTATVTTSANTPPVIQTSQSSVSITPVATGYFLITITSTSSTTLGYYNITVQGKTSTLSHSITVSADVTPPPPPPTPDFYLSSSSSSLTTAQGGSVAATLTISSVLSYSGNVALIAGIYPSGVNSPRVSLNLTTLMLPGGGNNATTVVVNAFNSTAGSYTISITGTSGTHVHTLFITLSVTPFSGYESLIREAYYLSSSTNTTLYIRNAGSVTTTLTSYYVVNASGNQYALTTWNGPVINPNQLGLAVILIGPSCPNCVRTGSAFTFTPGSYTIVVVTSHGNQFAFTITISSQESLGLNSYSIVSATNVTLYIRNYGAVPVNFVSYNVTDASGDLYRLASFSGPTIPIGGTVAVSVTIGSSCPNCTLKGNPFTFTTVSSFTISFLTSRNNGFWFTV
jgi:hypothetical protein